MYPHLGTPSTDSLTLVWTYRKGKLVNVPANLLVEGDVIVLGPGQQCPARVQQVCERLLFLYVFSSSFTVHLDRFLDFKLNSACLCFYQISCNTDKILNAGEMFHPEADERRTGTLTCYSFC